MIVVDTMTGRIAIPARLIWSIMENENDELAVIRVNQKDIYTIESLDQIVEKYKEVTK